MADDETRPDPPHRPRGAGWDDEDDWVRRDLGPRPHVPDHGRRPLLMALPIFLITVAAVIALLVAGCGGDDANDPAGSAPGTTYGGEPAPTQAARTPEDVAKKISESAALIAGLANPDAFDDTTCEAGKAPDEYRCAFGGEGDPDSGSLTVRAQADGSIGKVLGGEAPPGGQPDPTRVAELLEADDRASGGTKHTYACAASTAINPDGSSAGSSVPGFRCAALRGTKPVAQRYVQFGADGTAVRDFEVEES